MTSRRTFIKALAAIPPALVYRPAWSAADPSRVALVIGNSAYQNAPLLNPLNDARAIGGLLSQAGFTVDSVLDGTHDAMMAAIQGFIVAAKRAETKMVVFYYAGHGAQLEWRNYLLPIDAKIENQEHLKQRCVDLNLMLAQLSAAKDKTTIIILDACRNNPFGTAFKVDQKGLSQFDAPVGSLLAYATAPGNVASDGEGANGLYTENLVRELGKRGTRIEDALKRVRLNVRLASHGEQIPWETTSLESDVFIFNDARQKLSDTEAEKQLEAEIAAWVRIKSSNQTADWVDYLQNFPNGRFAEIAQMRLNRLLLEAEKVARATALAAEERQKEAQRIAAEKQREEQERVQRDQSRLAEALRVETERRKAERVKIETARQLEKETQRRTEAEKTAATQREAAKLTLAAPPTPSAPSALRAPSAEGVEPAINIRAGAPIPQMIPPSANPFSAGRYPLGRTYTVGDEASYRESDLLTDAETSRNTVRVTRVDREADRVYFNDGMHISDLMGNFTKLNQKEYNFPLQIAPAEYQVGKKWTAAFLMTHQGHTSNAFYELHIPRRETISVPAGDFDTFYIEGKGWNLSLGGRLDLKIWLVPGLNFPIKRELLVRAANGRYLNSERIELVSLRQHVMGNS